MAMIRDCAEKLSGRFLGHPAAHQIEAAHNRRRQGDDDHQNGHRDADLKSNLERHRLPLGSGEILLP
ncbi:MAG: hypothetical protein K9L59_02525 [Desulfobacterales bacterium]|nr:hypothetical protein [Desulfobacterales bacterium]